MRKYDNCALVEFRKSRGLSVRQLADEINKYLPDNFQLSFPAISAWEQNRNPIPFYLMFYLSHKAKGELKEFAQRLVKMMAEG